MDFDAVYKKECRCPTCQAPQPWQNECRRCGTDLSQLCRLAKETVLLRQKLVSALDPTDKQTVDQETASILLNRLKEISPTSLIGTIVAFQPFGTK